MQEIDLRTIFETIKELETLASYKDWNRASNLSTILVKLIHETRHQPAPTGHQTGHDIPKTKVETDAQPVINSNGDLPDSY
jgi:hypothetical protein